MPELLAVFDTNVIVSGFLSPHGSPGRIVDWLRLGAVRAVVDDRIVAEYRSVVKRPKLSLPATEVDTVLEAILSHAIWVEVRPGCLPWALPDADDTPFAECSIAAGSPLVTGNIRHFPSEAVGQVVLSPTQFVEAAMAV